MDRDTITRILVIYYIISFPLFVSSAVRYGIESIHKKNVTARVTITPGSVSDCGYYYGVICTQTDNKSSGYLVSSRGQEYPIELYVRVKSVDQWYQWFRFPSSLISESDSMYTASLFLQFDTPVTTGVVSRKEGSMLQFTERKHPRTLNKRFQSTSSPFPFTEGLKIMVAEDGIYTLSPDLLQKYGVPVGSIDTRTFRLFSRGREVPIVVSNEHHRTLQKGDQIIFYGQALYKTDGTYYDYSEMNCYWLTWGNAYGARTAVISGARREDPTLYRTSRLVHSESYTDTLHCEKDETLIWLGDIADEPPRELTIDADAHSDDIPMWYWGVVGVNTLTNFTFKCYSPQPRTTARVIIGMIGLSSSDSITPDHTLQFFMNENPTGVNNSMSWDGQRYVRFESDTFSTDVLVHGENQLTVQTYGAQGNDRSALDWIKIIYTRGYDAIDDQVSFRSSPSLAGNLVEYNAGGFTSDKIEVWDIQNNRKFTGMPIEQGSGDRNGEYTVAFQDSLISSAHYFVQAESKRISNPKMILDTITDKWDTLIHCDYIAVGTDSFYSALKPLLEAHGDVGTKTAFVAIEDIFNTFSYGISDPEAIRTFAQYLISNGGNLHYLLLVGDCTHNLYKKDIEMTIVPTHLTRMPGWGPGADDGYFSTACGEDMFADFVVGRFPVKNCSELEAIVEKTVVYIKNPDMSYWRDNFLLLGGGESEFTEFNTIAQEQVIGSKMHITRMDAYPSSDYYVEGYAASEKIADYCNTGMFIVNFNGHGGGNVWSDNDFFSYSDIPLLHNGQWKGGRFPLVLSFTCLTGFFESSDYRSLGEEFVRRKSDGTVAFYGASAYTSRDGNIIMNRIFLEELLSGGHKTIGDLINFCEMSMQVRYRSQYLNLVQQYNLLGDPALPLKTIPDTLHVYAVWNSEYDTVTISGSCYPVDTGKIRIAVVSGSTVQYQTVNNVENGTFSHAVPIKRNAPSYLMTIRVYAWNMNTGLKGTYTFKKDMISVEKVTVDPNPTHFNDSVTISCRLLKDNASDTAVQMYCMYAVTDREPAAVSFSGVTMKYSSDSIWKSAVPIYPAYNGNINERLVIYFRLSIYGEGVESRLFTFPLVGRPDCTIAEKTCRVQWSGDSLIIPFTVHNIGNAPAERCRCSILLSEHGTVMDTLATVFTSDTLFPGEYEKCFATIEDTAGILSLSIVIDPDGNIAEIVEDNNRLDGICRIWSSEVQQSSDTLHIDPIHLSVSPNNSFNMNHKLFFIEDTIGDTMPLATPSKWGIRRSGMAVRWQCSARPPLSSSDSLEWNIVYTDVASVDSTMTTAAFVVYDTLLHKWRYFAGTAISDRRLNVSMVTNDILWYSYAFLSDNTPPELMVSVHGRALTTIDYTAKNRPFTIIAADPSSLLPQSIQLLLNGNKLDKKRYSSPPTSGDLTGITLSVYPDVEHTVDSLEIHCSDLAGNSIHNVFPYIPGKDLSIQSFSCHPNPFTARKNDDGTIAAIRFAFLLTDIADKVTLSIFTVSGKKIRMWSEYDCIGYQQIEWNGRDHDGYRLANGTYYAKLSVKNDRKKDTKIIRIAKLEGF